VAIVSKIDGQFVVEQQLISSQADIHAYYGGVVPEVAAREHSALIFPLLVQAGIPRDGEGIDAIAVTAGPGLVPALRIGVELAKALSWIWKKPLVPVNHLEGHIYSVLLNGSKTLSESLTSRGDIEFPALCLLVSGGHTELVLMKGHGDYQLIGRTRDDAAGEAFDKVAKLLGLPYPGGPHISKQALNGNPEAIDFPRPMLHSKDLDFSFSGLKTAVRLHVEQNPSTGSGNTKKRGGVPTPREISDITASFQQSVVDVLVYKTLKAVELHNPKTVILSGGVSANTHLRTTLANALSPTISFRAPDLALTGDNAAMIAVAGIHQFEAGNTTDPLTLVADPNRRLA